MRVNYDEHNWKLLIEQLKTNHKLIDNVNRAELVDDSFNLGRAEIINQTVFLELVEYLEREEDPIAFVPANVGLEYIVNMFSNSFEAYSLFIVCHLTFNYI